MTKKDPIDELRTLVLSLTDTEQYVVQKQLAVYAAGRSKTSQALFNLLRKDTGLLLTEKRVAEKLYPGDARGLQTLRMLKARLKDRILECLIHDTCLHAKKDWDEIELESIKLRKALSIYYFLFLTKKKQSTTKNLLDNIIEKSRKYEFYMLLIDALKFKKYDISFLRNAAEFDKINNEISILEKAQRASLYAGDLFYKMLIYQRHSSSVEKQEYIQFLKTSIQELKILSQQNKSSNVKFYELILMRNLASASQDTETLEKVSIELINLLRNNPAVYRRERIGSALLFLANHKITQGNFNESKTLLNESLESLKPLSDSYFIAKNSLMIINFYTNCFHEALEQNEVQIKSTREIEGVFTRSKYEYYKANILFKLGRFKECLRSIQSNTALTQDKTGYNQGIRILTLMTQVELEYFDQAAATLEALRKHVGQAEIKKSMRPRDLVIVEIVRALGEQSFNFRTSAKKISRQLAQLEETATAHSFEYFTHELIPFQTWFKEKAGLMS